METSTAPAPRLRLFLDVETTGLDPHLQEIIEIALVVEEISSDPAQVGRILDTFESKVKPLHFGAAHPKALAVNGYTPEGWKDAPTFAEILDTVESFLKRTTCLVGHNVNFDLNFIEAAFRKEGRKLYLPYHRIDTVTSAYMAWGWFAAEDTKLKLDSLRERLGIPTHEHHSALVDALDCRRVLYMARGTLTGIDYRQQLGF